MTDQPPMSGLIKDADGNWTCPRCDYTSGNEWSQCEGVCPIVGSPHYDPKAPLYPVSDWQSEVANGDTRLGYDDWLKAKVEQPF